MANTGGTKMVPKGIEEAVARLKKAGISIDLVEINGQCYVLVRNITAPAPPWDRPQYDILIAVPVTFEQAGLDGFYLRQPHTFNGAGHPRVQGQVITYADATWRLVSWHYADGHSWASGTDSLETHIEHCHGFFSGRGATNDYR